MTTAIAVQPAANPLAILALAVERGADPDQLEKLLALQERYERREAEKAFAVAMTACQAEMPCVVRDRENTHTRSMYAALETIEDKVRPVYTKHKFSPTYGTEPSSLEGHIRLVCDLLHVGGHSHRYAIDLPTDGAGLKGTSNKTPVQAAISSMTYGRRVLLTQMFNIVIANTDKDGNDGATIGPGQVELLKKLIAQTDTDPARFLKWAECESLPDMPLTKFSDARAFLERKLPPI